jgi:DNA polymerase III delta subunit
MKITLVHGENVNQARKRFEKIIESLRKRGWAISYVKDEETKNLVKIISTSDTFFNENTLFVVENFNKVPTSEINKLAKVQENISSNILFWQAGEAKMTLTKALPKGANLERYDLPKILFAFLESFFPGNSHNCTKLFHNLIDSEPIELVFAMLARHLRDLYWALFYPETAGFPSWKLKKLQNQAKKFGKGKIKELIGKLAQIDIDTKSSKLDLESAIDLIIISELE